MAQVIEGPGFSVPLACRIDQRQVEGVTLLFESLFKVDEYVLSNSRADETAGRHDIPIPDDGGGLLAGNDFPLSPYLGTEFLDDGVR
jgi:hypothetical protein